MNSYFLGSQTLKMFFLAAVLAAFSGTVPAYGDTLYIFKVTFEGSGTYTYASTPFPCTSGGGSATDQIKVDFSWNDVFDPVYVSQDRAANPDNWTTPVGQTAANATGNLTGNGSCCQPSDSYTCSGTIKAGDAAINIYAAAGGLQPGIQFTVEAAADLKFSGSCSGCRDLLIFDLLQACVEDPRTYFTTIFTLPPDALTQGKIIQKVNSTKTLPACPVDVPQTLTWSGTVTFEKIMTTTTTTPVNPCPAVRSLDREEDVMTLRMLRNFWLESPDGIMVTLLYYRNAPEVSALLAKHPSLQERFREAVINNLDSAEQLINAGFASVPAEGLGEACTFLSDLREQASPALQRDIDMVLHGIEDGTLLRGLSLRVK